MLWVRVPGNPLCWMFLNCSLGSSKRKEKWDMMRLEGQWGVGSGGGRWSSQNLVQGISWPFHPVLCVIPRTKPGQCIKAPVLPAKTPVPRARLRPAGASSRMCNWGTLEATDMTNGRNRKCIFFIHRQHIISGDIADKFKSCHRNLNVNSFCFPITRKVERIQIHQSKPDHLIWSLKIELNYPTA